MKLAIVHDWLLTMGGAERVLVQLHAIWPQAPIYTLLTTPSLVAEHLPGADVRTSSLSHIPFSRRLYPYMAPLMPSAMESFDFSGYDTVLSSSVMFAKGIIVRPGTRHICYCYSPSRMLWDRSASYERSGIFSRAGRHALRTWDYAAAKRPDTMLAISDTVAARIGTYYRRHAMVIPPPVAMPEEASSEKRETGEPFYLIVSRLMPHKNLDMVVDAFNKLGHRLVIAGSGPLAGHLARRANRNIVFTGWLSDAGIAALYRTCRAVIVPNDEDFGLTAVEAMSYGKPVLALRNGGATETVVEGLTGEFFDDAIPEALADGIKRIAGALDRYDPATIRSHAAQWSPEHFASRMRAIIETV